MGRSNVIPFRLRKGRDDDIAAALDALPEHVDRSDVIRTALRLYFSQGNTNIPEAGKHAASGHTPAAAGLKIEGVELTKKEKSAEELDGALDDLLNF